MLDYFQEKLQNFFSKNPKNPYLGSFWVLFPQIWAKMNFTGKKGLCQFLCKNQKKLQSHSRENVKLTDG